MSDYEDTYFLNPQEALRVASEQNRWGDNNYSLQACYYDGEKLDSELSNLINVSLDNLVEELAEGTYRIPTVLDFTGLNLSIEIELNILTNFNLSIEHAKNYREQYNKHYLEAIENLTLDFDEPLRFYIMASTSTQVMQYVSRNIAHTLKERGYKVFFDLREGAEDAGCFQKILKFKPHASISINHFNNGYLNDDAFNFVWFQDPMPIFYMNGEIYQRKRDFVYSLLEEFDEPMIKKGVIPTRQSFCVNTRDFKIHENIERKKKIVFVGSSYGNGILQSENVMEAIEYITLAFNNGENLNSTFMEAVAKKFTLNEAYLLNSLLQFVVRDTSVLWLCSHASNYEIEIYGHGWDVYESVRPFYKGALNYGDDIAEVYNGATYCFAPHQAYALQQRVLESAACGCIPIVYDCFDKKEDREYEEALEYFKTPEDLKHILFNDDIPNKDFTKLLSENSYEYFVDEIINTIKKEL